MPLVGTFTSGGISKDVTKCVVLRLTASDGTPGISSIEPSASVKSPGTPAELGVAVRERVAPAIVGHDATNINRLIPLLDKLTPTQPARGQRRWPRSASAVRTAPAPRCSHLRLTSGSTNPAAAQVFSKDSGA